MAKSEYAEQPGAPDPLEQLSRARSQYTSDRAVTTLGSYDDFRVAGERIPPPPVRFSMGGGGGGVSGGGGGSRGDGDAAKQKSKAKLQANLRARGERGQVLLDDIDRDDLPNGPPIDPTWGQSAGWRGHPNDYAAATQGGRGGDMGSVFSKGPGSANTSSGPRGLGGPTGLGGLGGPSTGTAGVGARIPRSPSSGSGGASIGLPIDAASWSA
jgi:hypothetical protein